MTLSAPPSEPTRGILFLVVGPSGAGKDTLIDYARDRLRPADRFHIATRLITRPSGNGEQNQSVDLTGFTAAEAAGDFLLSWQAHGLRYGLSVDLAPRLAAGQHVIANVSRTVIEDARARLQPLHILSIVATRAVLKERLEARGRESAEEVDRRLARAFALPLAPAADLSEIPNNATREAAGQAFVDAIHMVVKAREGAA